MSTQPVLTQVSIEYLFRNQEHDRVADISKYQVIMDKQTDRHHCLKSSMIPKKLSVTTYKWSLWQSYNVHENTRDRVIAADHLANLCKTALNFIFNINRLETIKRHKYIKQTLQNEVNIKKYFINHLKNSS